MYSEELTRTARGSHTARGSIAQRGAHTHSEGLTLTEVTVVTRIQIQVLKTVRPVNCHYPVILVETDHTTEVTTQFNQGQS